MVRMNYKNALRLSEDGIGDGTVYASATASTPNISTKTFTTTDLALISDIGADSDNKWNGYLLYFPTSKNSYHILDYQYFSYLQTFTVYENPDANDVGACQVRAALMEPNSTVPALKAVSGFLWDVWQGLAGVVQRFWVHLPNMIDDGGFEQSTAGSSGYFSETSQFFKNTTQVLGTGAGGALDPDTIQVSQGFKVSHARSTYAKASFSINSVLGSPTGGIEVRIETDSGGLPSGTLVDANATQTVTSPVVGTNTVTFPGQFSLTSGTQYHIVLNISHQATNTYWRIDVTNANPYPDGSVNVKTYPSTWSSYTVQDMYFDILYYSASASSFSSDWTASSSDWTPYTTSPLLGTYSAQWTPGSSNQYLYQVLSRTLTKGLTYTILMKVKALGGSPSAEVIQVRVREQYGSGRDLDTTMGTWTPTISTTAGWVSTTFTPAMTPSAVILWINGVVANKGAATSILIDELYIWENISVDRIIIANHNFDQNSYTVTGYNASPLRTGITTSDYSALVAVSYPSGTETIDQSLTSGTYPVYEIQIVPVSYTTLQAGEIWLTEEWTWERTPPRGFDPEPRKPLRTDITAKSGSTEHVFFYDQRIPKIALDGLSLAEADRFTTWWERAGRYGDPFWLYIPGPTGATPLLTFYTVDPSYGSAYMSTSRKTVTFNLKEQL